MGLENQVGNKEVKKKTKSKPYTSITDPDMICREDLEWLLEYFGEVDPVGVPSDRSKLAIIIINNYRKRVEQNQPKRFDAHNLF